MRRRLTIIVFALFTATGTTGLVIGNAHAEHPGDHGEKAPGGEHGAHDGDHSDHSDHGGEHAGAHGEEHGGGSHGLNWFTWANPKDAHPSGPLFWALVNFGLLLTLLGWKAKPAIRAYMVKKQDNIKTGLEEGTRLREEAEAKLAEYDKRIKDVDAEVNELVSDIRKEAEAEKERILAEAKAQAEATKKATEERISAELNLARTEIEREVVAAAVAAAEKILKDKVSPQDQQALIGNFIDNLPKMKAEAQTGGQA